jgi:hypothetical protein
MDSWIAVRLAVAIHMWGGSVKTSFPVSPLRSNSFRQAEVRTHRPSTTRVTVEIEFWVSCKEMMSDGEGAPIDVEVQFSIFQLSRINVEAPNVAGDD